MHMENKTSARQAPETRGANRYYLVDEKTLNSYLYGTREVKVIDVNKVKRKVEGEQGMRCTYKLGNSQLFNSSI